MATLKPRDGEGLSKVIQGGGSKPGSAEALPTAHCPKLPGGRGLGSLAWVFPWVLEINARFPYPCGAEDIGVQRSQHESKHVGGVSPLSWNCFYRVHFGNGLFFSSLKFQETDFFFFLRFPRTPTHTVLHCPLIGPTPSRLPPAPTATCFSIVSTSKIYIGESASLVTSHRPNLGLSPLSSAPLRGGRRGRERVGLSNLFQQKLVFSSFLPQHPAENHPRSLTYC